MAEYRQKRTRGLRPEVSHDLVHEVPEEDPQGPDSGACARPDTSDLCCPRGVDHQRSGVAGSYSSVVVGAADPGSSEAGAGDQRAVVEADAIGIPGAAEAVLGTTHVSAGLLL